MKHIVLVKKYYCTVYRLKEKSFAYGQEGGGCRITERITVLMWRFDMQES